jgi:asparagine synthase (glutamine-hydrolysing)
MCGIAGYVALDGAAPAEAGVLAAMCDTIVHRGPDDDGHVADGPAGLGMRRLSIIDVESGRQPLINERGTVFAVFNGEIYNFRELRRDLESRGHAFRSGSDGEVLPHLWEEHGPGFVDRLNGMYGVAIWDRDRRTLTLARDRLGIKPLFWTVSGGRLVFASEIQAILASGWVEPETDVDALAQFLAWEYVPAPRTMFRGIRKLEAGSTLTLRVPGGEPVERRYWDVPAARDAAGGPRGAASWAEEVDETIAASVRRQLLADVPLGAFLSGGVDSSLVVAAMGRGAHTFSIGFDDPTYDEARWSRRVADHLGVDHRLEVIRPDALDLFERLMRHLDDPIADFSIFPTYLVSRFARERVKVALSGDGGDELFGGYETYLAQGMARRWNRIPRTLRQGVLEPAIRRLRPRPAKKGVVNKAIRFVEGLEHDAGLGHARWRVFAGSEMLADLLTPEASARVHTPIERHVFDLARRAGERSDVDRMLYVDVHSYLVDNCLVKVDRMSMATSLETRVPLLDHELVELAFRVPGELKVARHTKPLLKAVAERHVPRDCVRRPKQGFSIPIKHWLNGPLAPVVDALLDPATIREEGLFDAGTVRRVLDEHRRGERNHSHLIWGLIVFRRWKGLWGA